jgi:CelD/BcsL family acetyltransferase involved in cellulose biosynthesis
VTDFHRLEELSSQWERLWESDPRAEIFQTPEWSKAWWRAFGQDYSLCSLAVFAGHQMVGIVPLVRRDNFVQFLGLPEADYADIICEEHRATEVLALALKTLGESVTGWTECGFEHLPRHSRLVRHYRALPREIRARLHRVPAERQYTIILRNQREEVFKSLLGKNHTRRLQNKLRKAGQLRFRHLQTPDEIEAYLPDFFRHHVRRHAAIGRRSVCARPEFCQFIRAIIQELGPRGRVRFGVLELDGRALAWELAFQVNGKFMLYQHTFDLDASHYTPGEVILWNALEYARDNVSREFDFGSGDELYKDRFANYSRETYSLFVTPRGLRGWVRGSARGIQAFVQPGFSKMKEIAKSRRMTLRAFRAARMWMLGTWGCVRQARKNGSLLQCGLHLTKKVFGNSVWSRRSADVFALEPSRLGDGDPLLSTPSEGDQDVRVAQFGDLVDLSWQHPEILSLNELAQCRKRLQNGDHVYIVRENSDVVSVCWASGPAEAAAAPGTARIGIAASTPAIVIDELWSIRDRDLSASYRLLLSVLAREASRQKANILVYCSSEQPALRRELEHQGSRPTFRITRYRALGRLQRESVRPYPANSSYSAQAA